MVRLFAESFIAGVALAVLSLPILLAAALVRATSEGPAFYRQRRIGLRGRPFWLYKLRTMRVGRTGPALTADGDPRVTRLGALLRRWKIDELPQLWNVLRGEMSLVGPRPEVETFVRLYSDAERTILETRPGLAGMAQLLYPDEAEILRGARDAEAAYAERLLHAKLAADIEYQRRRSFASDLRLVARLGLMVVRRAIRTSSRRCVILR